MLLNVEVDEMQEINEIAALFHDKAAQGVAVLDRLSPDDFFTVYLASGNNCTAEEICNHVNRAFAERIGVNDCVLASYQEVWVPSTNLENALVIRQLLIAQGFNIVSIFNGVIRENEYSIIVKGENKLPYFPDSKGHSKTFYEYLQQIGFKPKYVFACAGIDIRATFDLTASNVDAAQKIDETIAINKMDIIPHIKVDRDTYGCFEIIFSLPKSTPKKPQPNVVEIQELRDLLKVFSTKLN